MSDQDEPAELGGRAVEATSAAAQSASSVESNGQPITSTDQSVSPAQQTADSTANAVSQDVTTLTNETSQAQSDWTQVQSALQTLRSNSATNLQDAAAAKSSRCNTFPDLPDSPDIGADSLLQTLNQIRNDTAQLETDDSSYNQIAQTTPATNPPASGAVSSAVSAATDLVNTLYPKVQAARSTANQIVNQEKAATGAAGC